MRRFFVAVTLLAILACATGAVGQGSKGKSGKTTPAVFKVRLIQEETIRHPHPPAGDVGDVFSTTLRLFAIGTEFGFPDSTPIGSMAFSWSDNGGISCSSSASGCKGKTDIKTLTRLPGGTITANSTNVSLAHGIVVAIQSGTGIFKGVKGTINIAPAGVAQDVFHLILPAS